MQKTPSFYSEPHVQFLSQILDEIEAGLLQIPRFQRPFIWDWDRRLELLRSIRDGIPIGAVMVWRTTSTEVRCYPNLGPYKLAAPEGGGSRSYLLDGVQRLSTLYGALHQVSQDLANPFEFDPEDTGIYDNFSPLDYDVYVDLHTSDFTTARLDNVTGLMPLSIVFDSVELLRFQRDLVSRGDEALIPVSDDIARAFREYKVPVIPISTDDVDMATRTFQRINSQGARMSEAHMVHALTWTPTFDLRFEIASLKSSTFEGGRWVSIDDDPILKTTKALLNLDVYKTNAQELSDAIRENPHALRDALHSIKMASDFLWTECRVGAPEMVPYSLQIVVLAAAFQRNIYPSADAISLLRSWFWLTTYGELFAGMSGDRVRLALADTKQMVETGRPHWTWKRPYEEGKLSRRFDFRAARTKALAFRLADRRDEIAGASLGSTTLADYGAKALVPGIPFSDRELYYAPFNRFLLHPEEVAGFRDRLSRDELSDLEMRAHLLSPEAMLCLSRGDERGFISQRREMISQYETQFIRPLIAPFVDGRHVGPSEQQVDIFE